MAGMKFKTADQFDAFLRRHLHIGQSTDQDVTSFLKKQFPRAMVWDEKKTRAKSLNKAEPNGVVYDLCADSRIVFRIYVPRPPIRWKALFQSLVTNLLVHRLYIVVFSFENGILNKIEVEDDYIAL
jgi:hypothetical protein